MSNRLILILILKAVVAMGLILFSGIKLAPDEAQYWTWSQALDFGYYSKPPGIAWQIFLTTSVFGNNELGVRFGAIIISFFLAIAIYKMAKNGHVSERGSFWSGVAMAFSPLGMYLTFAATTDGGAILGLTIALMFFVKALTEEKEPNYLMIGFWLYFGALFKWTVFIFYPFLLGTLFFYPFLRSKKIWLAFLIPLFAFLPPLYWNMTHDFATFKHVFATIHNKQSTAHGNFFSYFGAQIALISPIYLFLYLLGAFKRKKTRGLFFCALFSAFAALYIGASLFKKMQPNWAAFFYPPAFVLVGWYGIEKMKKGLLWLILGSCVALSIFFVPLFTYPYLPYKLNPYRQNLGWDHLNSLLINEGYDPKKDFLFSDTYQMASLLSFYGPEKKRAYFFNLKGSRKNQFSYWLSSQKEKGKDGYFVIAENVTSEALPWYESHYKEALTPYCASLEYIGAFPLFTIKSHPQKYAIIFRCNNYNGNLPPEKEKY